MPCEVFRSGWMKSGSCRSSEPTARVKALRFGPSPGWCLFSPGRFDFKGKRPTKCPSTGSRSQVWSTCRKDVRSLRILRSEKTSSWAHTIIRTVETWMQPCSGSFRSFPSLSPDWDSWAEHYPAAIRITASRRTPLDLSDTVPSLLVAW